MAMGTITINGVEHEIDEASPGDLIRFERKFNMPASKASDENEARFEWVVYLAYLGARRAGIKEAVDATTFDDFIDLVDDVDFSGDDDEDEAADPTDAGT